jgi:hypothetical protein
VGHADGDDVDAASLSMDVGLNRLTALWDATHQHVGWEGACNHPLHNKVGTRCRLNRKFRRFGDANTLLRMFKLWFARGLESNCRTAKDHAAQWREIEELNGRGDLPDVVVPPIWDWNELRDGFGQLSVSASSSSV